MVQSAPNVYCLNYGSVIISMMWLCVCVCKETTEDLSVYERWQQYWHDNGHQLVWNDWLQKYSEYKDCCFDSHCFAGELVDTDTVPETCQSDCVENENEGSLGSRDTVDSNIAMLFVSNQAYSLDGVDLGHSVYVDCQNDVEPSEPTVNCGGILANVTNAEDDVAGSSAVDVLKHGTVGDIRSDQEITSDESWNTLWEQHYFETYWYYYDWFMQWLNEEGQMLQRERADDVQQSVTAVCHSHDNLVPSLHSDYNSVHLESADIVESLLGELILTAVDSVSNSCPADGSGQKQRKKRKEKQIERGLFHIFYYFLA